MEMMANEAMKNERDRKEHVSYTFIIGLSVNRSFVYIRRGSYSLYQLQSGVLVFLMNVDAMILTLLAIVVGIINLAVCKIEDTLPLNCVLKLWSNCKGLLQTAGCEN